MPRFELHVHSNHSKDGLDSVEKILRRAITLGLDGIAITDHDTVSGAIEALELAEEQKIRILVIPGIEVSTRGGHLLVLGVRRAIPPKLSVEKTIRLARQMDGLVVAPHLGDVLRNSLKSIDDLDVDAIEVNAKPLSGSKVAEKIAAGRQLPMVAGSDAHCAELLGYAVTEIDCELNIKSVLEAIKTGRTRVTGTKIPFNLYVKQLMRKSYKKIF